MSFCHRTWLSAVTSCKTNIMITIHSTSNDIHTDGARAKTGDIRESGETGDSREEDPADTQWRQVIYHFIHQNTKKIC